MYDTWSRFGLVAESVTGKRGSPEEECVGGSSTSSSLGMEVGVAVGIDEDLGLREVVDIETVEEVGMVDGFEVVLREVADDERVEEGC